MLLPPGTILHGLASIFIDSSGWYAFTWLDPLILLMLFATEYKLNSNE